MPGVTKITLDIINEYSKERGVVCISKKYTNSKEKLKWRCLKCSFEFTSSKNNFDRYFKHCKNCYYNNGEINDNTLFLKDNDKPRNFYKHKQQLDCVLKSKGGKLVSKYNGSQGYIEIRCGNNHNFSAKFSNIVNVSTWCPECSQKKISISENIVRKYFETIFDNKFKSIRPNWLRSEKTGYNLELDGYCEELSIAFEHQGPHHYYDAFKKNNLQEVLYNDALKSKLCKERGIKLFIIDHLFKKTKLSDLYSVIKSQAINFGLSINKINHINITDCYYDDRLLELDLVASSKGGRLLDREYVGVSSKKTKWECKNGHIWQQYPYAIKRGSWCPVCVGYKKNTPGGVNIIKDNCE